MKRLFVLSVALAIAVAAQADAPSKAARVPVDSEGWPEAWFEIFKLAPGKQEEFIRGIARADAVAAAGSQPPIQIFRPSRWRRSADGLLATSLMCETRSCAGPLEKTCTKRPVDARGQFGDKPE